MKPRLLARKLSTGVRDLAPGRILLKAGRESVPYFAQWESRELVGPIIRKEKSPKDDPKWRDSGAASPEEYELWTWNLCGIACLKMILAAERGESLALVRLGKDSLGSGVYRLPLESNPGLFYKPFCRYVRDKWHLRAEPFSYLSMKGIFRALAAGAYVIASVTPEIRYPDQAPQQKSGHLILVLGYDLEKQRIRFHNPSGISDETQENAELSFTDFQKFFSGKGVIVYPGKS